MRLVKCYGTCDSKYPQNEMIKYKGANHCPKCYEAKVKDVEDREELYKFLQQNFQINFPTGLMLKQIKQFKEERGYTYKNIRFTIDYILRVKRINLQRQYGIAMVPHFYDEMISYYKDLKERRERTVVKDIEVITVMMKPLNLENKYRNKKLINMEDLLNE